MTKGKDFEKLVRMSAISDGDAHRCFASIALPWYPPSLCQAVQMSTKDNPLNRAKVAPTASRSKATTDKAVKSCRDMERKQGDGARCVIICVSEPSIMAKN